MEKVLSLLEIDKIRECYGLTGKNIKIAIIDSGCNLTPELLSVFKEGYNTIQNNTNITDESDHGTRVAKIFQKICPNCSLYIIKVLSGPKGRGLVSDIIEGILWAIERNVDTINLSLGDDKSCDGTCYLCKATSYAVSKGIIVTTANGNSGEYGFYTTGSPACAKGVISVGAVDTNKNIKWYSSKGPTKDGRTRPHLVTYSGFKINGKIYYYREI